MAVLGGLEIVRRRTEGDPKIVALLDNAIQGAKRGVSLAQRMLAFARRQELDRELVGLTDLVRGMADLLRQSVGPRIQIDTHFPLSLRSVLVDANQIELALLNLAVNARDAMPDGGTVTISVRERRLDQKHGALEPGEYVCLTLQDEGIGMDAETLERATEPFFTTKGVGKGTGLGLSMVHGLAAQSGSQLVLKSGQGRGTTAELWLPIAADDVIRPTNAVQPPHPVQQRRAALNVLAVDDDPLVLMTTGAMLEELGCQVFEAGSAKQALDILAQNTIDLVLTDQAMPQMTGSELAEVIRNRNPTLPVVLVTGYAEKMSGLAGELPKLSKPFNQKTLAQTIASVVNQC